MFLKQVILLGVIVASCAAKVPVILASERVSGYTIWESTYDQATSAAGDYFIAESESYDALDYYVQIFKRNEGGYYDLIYRKNFTDPCVRSATNGEWFAYTIGVNIFDPGNVSAYTEVFRLSDDNQPKDMTRIDGLFSIRQFLNDGTMILQNSTTFLTYLYDGSDWSLKNAFNEYNANGIWFQLSHLTETTLSVIREDSETISLYERQSDYSWSLAQTLNMDFNDWFVRSILRIGDTLIIGTQWREDSTGDVIRVLQFDGADWTQVYGAQRDEFNYNPVVFNGFVFLQVTQDVVLVAGTDAESNTRVSQIDRLSGQWRVTVEIKLPTDEPRGYHLAKNDHDVLLFAGRVLGEPAAFQYAAHTVPACYSDRINVTCHNGEIADCMELTEISQEQRFTINGDSTCAPTVSVTDVTFEGDQGITFSHTFERFPAPLVTCESKFTCKNKNQFSAASGAVVSFAVLGLALILV